MNKYLLLLLIAKYFSFECLKNCYIGAGLYSHPIDALNCCADKPDINCFSYLEQSTNQFICKQCKIGYHFENSKCMQNSEDQICINPEARVLNQNEKCKVCKITKASIRIPKLQNSIYVCKEATIDDKELPNFKNCLASVAHSDVIFCHECKTGFFYDETQKTCRAYRYNPILRGCLISFLWGRCDLCREGYQFDSVNYICVSGKRSLDLIKMKIERERKIKLRKKILLGENEKNGKEQNQKIKATRIENDEVEGL